MFEEYPGNVFSHGFCLSAHDGFEPLIFEGVRHSCSEPPKLQDQRSGIVGTASTDRAGLDETCIGFQASYVGYSF